MPISYLTNSFIDCGEVKGLTNSSHAMHPTHRMAIHGSAFLKPHQGMIGVIGLTVQSRVEAVPRGLGLGVRAGISQCPSND